MMERSKFEVIPSPHKPPPCRELYGGGGETKESKQRTKEWSNNLTKQQDKIDIPSNVIVEKVFTTARDDVRKHIKH